MHHLTLFSWLSSLFFLFPWCVTSENNVLCDVYQSTSIGDRLETGHMTGWECFRGQPDAELCEDWSGVKCDRQGNVKYLDISGQNLTGTLPSSLGNLEHLQQLFVGSNFLNGTIPISLSKLGKLSSLSLQSNKFVGTIPDGLSALVKLKSLHLDHNNLTGTIPSSLGALTLSLTDLTASDNLLTGTLPASLASGGLLRKGRVVDFSYNRLHGEIPVELCLARNMFLIANNITNRCKEICRDKKYREGNIHILTKEEGGGAKRAKEEEEAKEKEAKEEGEMAQQLAEEARWTEEESEEKELEDFKRNLKNMINL